MPAARLQVTVWPVATQSTGSVPMVRPAGIVSVIVPARVSAWPLLVTVIRYWLCTPTTRLPCSTLATSSRGALIDVVVVLWQCDAAGQLASPPPLAVPVLIAGEAVPTPIVTGTVIGGALEPGSSTCAVVQLTVVVVLAEQSQPVPDGVAVVVMPAGSGSPIVIVPAVLVVPVLPTCRVYVAAWPTANVAGLALLVRVSCGAPPLVFVVVLDTPQGGVVQIVPAGGVAVAVLTMAPVALNCAVPVTVIVRLWPAPRATAPRLIVLVVPVAPVPAAPVSQSAPAPLATQVHAVTVTAAGTLSLTLIPLAAAGPLLVSVIV